ncbi:MAG: efflux RND transporter periplasmic adaptor subunit [Candidatus Marinimicrobia bacterium]|nr:efflux RND transporter periplasmic adaptor subunit [Candidatus Neomarinimicrobiota bacterium]MCF7828628.1 efflux RND transporter periplasmic adaptor subunit [Candidatus Neomarinimicrobiota bacterium]MCF7880369.1 efflux RND transporter periplasmic adaptor subunit [Candidatus Neomarinimicrobiota bacterium]
MKKWIFIVIGIVLVVSVVFLATKNGKSEQETYKTLPVTRGTIVEKALAVGTITSVNEIQVKSKIAGNVKQIYAEVGDEIEEGMPLVNITPDPTPLELTEARRNVEIAEVAYEQAERGYNRQKQLLEKNLISAQEFEAQKLHLDEANLRLTLNKERLSLLEKGTFQSESTVVESKVKAPITGTILEKFVNVGDPVVPLTSYQAGTPIFTLADMNELIFRGTIDEIDVGKVKVGMPAEIKIGALPGQVIEGTVDRISPKARKEENATLFDIEIVIQSSDSTELRAGYSANADIIIKRAKDVLQIPERLLTFEEDTIFTEVELADGTVENRRIEIGLSDGVYAEVTDGLEDSTLVVERPPKVIE